MAHGYGGGKGRTGQQRFRNQGLGRGQGQMGTARTSSAWETQVGSGYKQPSCSPWAGVTEVASALESCFIHTWERILVRAEGAKSQGQDAAIYIGPWKLGQPPRCPFQNLLVLRWL